MTPEPLGNKKSHAKPLYFMVCLLVRTHSSEQVELCQWIICHEKDEKIKNIEGFLSIFALFS
jgi:hypothetical protein